MTKKHFISAAKQIANIVHEAHVLGDAGLATEAFNTLDVAERCALLLADIFQQENSKFDRDRFLKACSVR